MTQSNNLTREPINSAKLGKRMLFGAAIAFVVISAFLISAPAGDPAWGKFWMLRPLVITPCAGACGGAFFYAMDYLSYRGGWIKTLAIVVGVFGYMVALWLGTVLGLAGTFWH
ncbi:MAG: potassium transporter KefB [Pedobacter sp.]|jgi:hypothetical protein|nr:potassium transporter KefB [Pedobacter sp.]